MNTLNKSNAIEQINRILGYEFMPIGFLNDYSEEQIMDTYINVVISKKVPIYSIIEGKFYYIYRY